MIEIWYVFSKSILFLVYLGIGWLKLVVRCYIFVLEVEVVNDMDHLLFRLDKCMMYVIFKQNVYNAYLFLMFVYHKKTRKILNSN